MSVSVNNIAGLVVGQVSPIGLEHIGFKFFYVFVACDIVGAFVYWRFFPEYGSLLQCHQSTPAKASSLVLQDGETHSGRNGE